MELLVLFLLFIFIRALLFNPNESFQNYETIIEFDKEKAIKNLAELVKCKTISYNDKSLEDDNEFQKLINLLPGLYPNVFKVAEVITLPDRALLIKIKGKSNINPSVMMAHYDVVPVKEENWDKPPFSAIIENGVMWGRGTLDTKVTVNAILSAADNLLKSSYTPENDLYFAFSGGEEVNGLGAVNIVNYFVSNDIKPFLVLDEGGAVVNNVFPGVNKPSALIGIAEKGMINVEYKTLSKGGHASAPLPNSPIIKLSKAALKIEKKPFKMHITKPAALMFDIMGRNSSFVYKLLFANMWCFSWVIDLFGKISGGEINALLRTTVAFTQMQGSDARNVIPPDAAMISNIRLNPADSVNGALDYLRKVINDDSVLVSAIESSEPSPISETNCEQWDRVASAAANTWKGSIVSPYLMVQCSDSRHYKDLSNHVYRFSAMDLTADERKTIHGNNERIRLETIEKSVEFYIRLLKNC